MDADGGAGGLHTLPNLFASSHGEDEEFGVEEILRHEHLDADEVGDELAVILEARKDHLANQLLRKRFDKKLNAFVR